MPQTTDKSPTANATPAKEHNTPTSPQPPTTADNGKPHTHTYTPTPIGPGPTNHQCPCGHAAWINP